MVANDVRSNPGSAGVHGSPVRLVRPRESAGGGLQRPSRLAPAAIVEPDPLLRLLVIDAVAALGLDPVVTGDERVSWATPPEVTFVSLAHMEDCRRACAAARGGSAAAVPVGGSSQGDSAPFVVGYVAGPAGVAAAHRVHRCADLVVRFAVQGGRPTFVHLPAADRVAAAGLTEREADVLVLLLAGLPTAAIAARLVVSPHTARTHCRSVLRKLGAADRGQLRASLCAQSPSAS